MVLKYVRLSGGEDRDLLLKWTYNEKMLFNLGFVEW